MYSQDCGRRTVFSFQPDLTLMVSRDRRNLLEAGSDFRLRVKVKATSGLTSAYCQRVLDTLVRTMAEHEKIVSTNSVNVVRRILKITINTQESYLRSQQRYRRRGASAQIL
jgi:hypothetical protein